MHRLGRTIVAILGIGLVTLLCSTPASAAQASAWGPPAAQTAAVGWGGHYVRHHPTPPPPPPTPPPPPVVAAPVAGGCATNGVKISGTVQGADGDYVNVMLGFDLQDSQHRAIGLNGCLHPSGYGTTVHLNHCITSAGSTVSTPTGASYGDCQTLVGTKSWSVVLPGNATYMYIEAYPKQASSRAAIGVTDESKYGMSYRRAVLVHSPGVRALKLPVLCGQGGNTGTLAGGGYVGSSSAAVTSIDAWSMAADGDALNPILGMNTGKLASGAYTLPALVPGKYTIIATVGGVTKQLYNVPVRACTTTRYDLHF